MIHALSRRPCASKLRLGRAGKSQLTACYRSWRKYVRLFYLESMDVNRKDLTLTLRFLTDPDLTLKFPNKTKYAAKLVFAACISHACHIEVQHAMAHMHRAQCKCIRATCV